MSLANQFTKLEALAQELENSATQLLDFALQNGIHPVVAIEPNWRIGLVCFSALSNRDELSSPLLPKTKIYPVEDVECIQLSHNDYTKLRDDGIIQIKVFDIIHLGGVGKKTWVIQTARQRQKAHGLDHWQTESFDKPLAPPILFPCFTIIDSQGARWDDLTIEDFRRHAGILVRLGNLRLQPADEARLRDLLSQPQAPTKAPTQMPVTGDHISPQLGQLLQVFNELQIWIEERQQENPPLHSDEVKTWLHQQLKSKNSTDWKSPKLRDIAIKLIYPPQDGQRTKKRKAYKDGLPVVLDHLVKQLQEDLSHVRQFKTSSDYESWLVKLQIKESPVAGKLGQLITETDAKSISTIIRLTPSQRGGRR
ncbi:hypothetical protein [Comamonas odontotermitis]|uniref:hypothetical protein n=1 Tax=Comamonas odontotermitis TaxID=379895 RepID=UPI001CC5B0EF|nr:hypothetical protein [Comamonas odontotermitis]UBB15733.1 hypothetical protein LAD35_12770 [Comamonas odontotermitis]